MHNNQDYKEQRNLNLTPDENLNIISNNINKIFSKKKNKKSIIN